jgi:hypothetical protein
MPAMAAGTPPESLHHGPHTGLAHPIAAEADRPVFQPALHQCFGLAAGQGLVVQGLLEAPQQTLDAHPPVVLVHGAGQLGHLGQDHRVGL